MTDDLLEENVDVVHAVLKEHAPRYGLRPAKKKCEKSKKRLDFGFKLWDNKI